MMGTAANVGLFDRLVAHAVPIVPGPIVRRLGAPYVGGVTLDEALPLVADLQRQHLETTVDILGESVDRESGAIAAADAYLSTLDALAARGLSSHISLKPSGMGCELGWAIAAREITRVVERAEEQATFVRIDMEDVDVTDATLALYRDLRARGHDKVGIVLQARLWRTAADVEALADLQPKVRLCKGIYLEPPDIGMQDRDAIRGSFSALLRRLLGNGSYVAIATHDEELIVDALAAITELGIGRDRYEFQTLLGVRSDLARMLARNHTMRVYVPYGSDSVAYGQRRLRENPQIAGYVARDTLRGMAKAVHLSK
jgi:proline dehydrogenase